MDLNIFITRILVALAAGMAVGIERQLQNKVAGLRTHALVAVGAAIYILVALKVLEGGNFDPTRVLGQVVTGIGFLGAGVILHQGASVYGLTTAATIWCSAGLGCIAAFGYYAETVIATLLILSINFLLRKVDEMIEQQKDKEK